MIALPTTPAMTLSRRIVLAVPPLTPAGSRSAWAKVLMATKTPKGKIASTQRWRISGSPHAVARRPRSGLRADAAGSAPSGSAVACTVAVAWFELTAVAGAASDGTRGAEGWYGPGVRRDMRRTRVAARQKAAVMASTVRRLDAV